MDKWRLIILLFDTDNYSLRIKLFRGLGIVKSGSTTVVGFFYPKSPSLFFATKLALYEFLKKMNLKLKIF